MKTLKQFYRELQAWIDDGCHEHEVFRNDTGLCHIIQWWSGNDEKLKSELEGQFEEAGLHFNYPLNDGDRDSFGSEVRKRTLYKNPARLQWIKEHAK